MKLEIVERFLSIQGEGLLVGTPAYFVRLARCNLRCPWCDTKYSWTSGKHVKIEDLISEILPKGVPLVVVTGGEPLLQQEGLSKFEEMLRKRGFDGIFQVETNGTIYPRALEGRDVWLTLSPKVTCDYYMADVETIKKIINNFSKVELKLVARASDIPCVKRFMRELGDVRVPKILQPLSGEGDYSTVSRELTLRVLEDKELRREFRVIPQIHKFIEID